MKKNLQEKKKEKKLELKIERISESQCKEVVRRLRLNSENFERNGSTTLSNSELEKAKELYKEFHPTDENTLGALIQFRYYLDIGLGGDGLGAKLKECGISLTLIDESNLNVIVE